MYYFTGELRGGRNIREGYFRGAGLELGTLHELIYRDAEYNSAISCAANRSIATPHRLLNLFMLVKFYMPKLPFGHIIEFGAYRGGTALFMAGLAKRIAPGIQVYALDTYQGMPQTDPNIDAPVAGDFSDASWEDSLEAKWRFGLDNLHFIKGKFEDTAPAILAKAKQISLAHIDCDIFSSVSYAYEAVRYYMVPHGYLIFDDSTAATCIGATEAVERLVIQRDGLLSEQIYPHHVFRAP